VSTELARTETEADLGLDHLDESSPVLMRPDIDRAHTARYLFRSGLLMHGLIALFSFGFWLPFLLLWGFGFGQWHSTKRSIELDYRLLPGRILVADGVFTKVRKTIPLDKVTDIALVQGIFDRWFGLWRVQIQTASSGQAAPEAMLLGLQDPKAFRRRVLEQRERWLDSGEPTARPEGSSPARRPAAALDTPDVGDKLDRIEALLSKIANNTSA
jgi:putative membrane protein